uniref:Arrestin domain-containing protein 3 n=1 Tax=Cyprinus carpio carpio TaxID=630221 RepID=A0A9J7XTH5_CYPCA
MKNNFFFFIKGCFTFMHLAEISVFDIYNVINKKMINALAGKVYLEYYFLLFQMMITLRRDSPLFIQEDMSMHSALSFHKRECWSDVAPNLIVIHLHCVVIFIQMFSLSHTCRPLATSFEGKHGSVRYWVKAELHRPWLLPMKTKKEFTVFEHIDINTPLLLSPQAGTKEKTLCCWFCTSGPISLSAKIERKGYTPGESIQIFAEIENCSSRMVVPKAAIYQTQTFFAKGKIKEIKQLVANIRGESLSSGKTETWNGKMLKIPPVSPSILDCSIIRVEYSLMVYVDIPGAMNLSLNLPLVVGTIPLHPFGSRTSSVSSQCSMTMSWLGMALPERPEGKEHSISTTCFEGCLQYMNSKDAAFMEAMGFESVLFQITHIGKTVELVAYCSFE